MLKTETPVRIAINKIMFNELKKNLKLCYSSHFINFYFQNYRSPYEP